MKKIYALLVALFVVNGAGAQWFYPNPIDSADYSAVYFTEENTGYIAKFSFPFATILKTTDGGMSWIQQYQGTGGGGNSIAALFFPNSTTGYAIHGSMSSFILKTTTGGSDWTIMSYLPDQFYSLFFTDTNTGYAVGFGKKILKTTDGGANWTTQFDDNGWLSSVFFVDANIGYAVGGQNFFPGGSNRTILKTTNGGLNWEIVLDEGGWPFSSVFFTSADTGYVAGGPFLLKTVNGGTDWIDLSYGASTAYFQSICFTNSDNGYAVGSAENTSCFILKTIDGGANWFIQSINGAGSQVIPNSMFFPSSNTGYIAGEGGILKTENGGGFPVGINDQNHIANTLKIYPTPAFTSITIETPAKGSLSIHNTSGQQLLQKAITEPTTTIDVSGLNRGVYLVKVIGEKGVLVGKFIKY